MFCNIVALGYNPAMKPICTAFSLLAVLFALNGCRTPGKQPPNVGPFDSRGNYVEAWADDPSKWRPYTPKDVEGDPPKIAINEQPPEHSVPLAPGNSAPARNVVSSHAEPGSTRTVAKTSSKPKPGADRGVAKTSSKPKSSTGRTAKSTSKPKPKTSVAKAKPKAKPAGARHTVKPGDSLSSIAASHGTTVAALKKANGISGTLIRDGKTLVIPPRRK
jgi:LysM repeat protein